MAEQKKTITSMLDERRVFNPPKGFSQKAHIKSMDEYKKLYGKSDKDLEGFWAEQANILHWFKKWDKVLDNGKAPFVKWFVGGKTNISYNCLDRHLAKKADKVALIWEGEPVGDAKKYTYKELHREVCKFANVLKAHGIKKGDRVNLYLPMIPELAISMLACTR
ncbi:MAG: acetyl-coenzyme A synthetase N-terminal domain-containing protein, partial [Candidatus Krumholzibacteria bacterium]|nr:acetyl-coenzyme A synthetase N-terminal domain-containing protein [Candidatus Krumholzibacteria bacterium]